MSNETDKQTQSKTASPQLTPLGMIVRYVGLTMAVLGGLCAFNCLQHSEFAWQIPIWLLIFGGGLALVFSVKKSRVLYSVPQDTPDTDPIKPLHILAVVTVYAAIPWGIVNLVRKKRKTGWFMIIGVFAFVAILFAGGFLLKVMWGL